MGFWKSFMVLIRDLFTLFLLLLFVPFIIVYFICLMIYFGIDMIIYSLSRCEDYKRCVNFDKENQLCHYKNDKKNRKYKGEKRRCYKRK